MSKKIIITIIAVSLAFAALNSCRQYDHKLGFEMQSEAWEERDSSEIPIYITDTKPIDSVDVNKMIFDIFRVEIDEYPENLKVYARVYDSLGNFVTNMAEPYLNEPKYDYWHSVKETLGVKLRRPAPIDSFHVREYGAGDSIPYNISLAIDYSGSMFPVREIIFEGVGIFVSLKSPYDKIAITTFNYRSDLKVPLLKDSSVIINTYNRKRENKYGLFSAVNDGMWQSMHVYNNLGEETTPRVLVVFSDGDDNESRKEVDDIIRRAKEQKIHVFVVAFGYSKDENLRSIAMHTGGKFYKAYTKEELVSVFRDIYMSLKYYYYITYKPPKFWGIHDLYVQLDVPGRTDTLIAKGRYDTSDLWGGVGDAFERPITFEFDSSGILPKSYYIIDEIYDAMYAQPRLKLEIQGHTDNVGTVEYNQKLSEDRANAVMQALLNKGIDPRRLRARGFGESEPKVPNDTEENRAQNRRTEFHILAK